MTSAPVLGHNVDFHFGGDIGSRVRQSMAVNPSSGALYLSNSRGDVLEYAADQPGAAVRVLLSGEQGLVRDYFGSYDPAAAGSMGFHWRQVRLSSERCVAARTRVVAFMRCETLCAGASARVAMLAMLIETSPWPPPCRPRDLSSLPPLPDLQVQWVDTHRGGSIVGMHGNSGYLFELLLPTGGGGAPETIASHECATDGRWPGGSTGVSRARLNLIERLTSAPSRRAGVSDQFSYGYLGFAVANSVVYYLTGGPIFGADGQRVAGKTRTSKGEAKGLEHLHLVTYELDAGVYEDHGAIFYSGRLGFPTYVNSIAIGGDGWVYALGRMPDGRTDLFRVRDPFAGAASC